MPVEVSADQTTARFYGREPKMLTLKFNPIWWGLNDDEQQVTDPDAQWYHLEWPQWRRKLYWNFFRNPLQNCRAYCGWYAFAIVAVFWLLVSPPAIPLALFFIGGVVDRNYVATDKTPVLTIQRNDLVPPQRGYQWCVLHMQSGLRLPFVSYSGKHVVWYIGSTDTVSHEHARGHNGRGREDARGTSAASRLAHRALVRPQRRRQHPRRIAA